MNTTSASTLVITPEQLRQHWQGHRKLTRRIIDAFPDDKLFDYSIGGMRPFSTMAMECIGMAVPTLQGVITGKWEMGKSNEVKTKADILALWDDTTTQIDKLWPTIPQSRFQETDLAFGQWEMPIWGLFAYVIDNEVHHRGQGYVYLRSLGIEPAPFYER